MTLRAVLNLTFALALTLLSGWTVRGADLVLKVIDKEPPKELDPAISAKLQLQVVQLLDGSKPVFEYWFVTEVPLQAKPAAVAKALDAVKPATLLGAVSVASAQRDYRDDEIATGVYTARFALQPQDGNHLGTAEFNYFAVLVPAKLDTRPDGIADYKALVKASSKQTGTEHPVIVSLRPASSDEDAVPKLTEPAPEHKGVRLEILARAGNEKTALVFELIYQGVGKK